MSMEKTMTSDALAAAFDPANVERGLYDRWDEAGYFAPNDREDRRSFVVIMPPPNVTGELHVGHALFVAIEDIMISWHRMLGGADHRMPGAGREGLGGL